MRDRAMAGPAADGEPGGRGIMGSEVVDRAPRPSPARVRAPR